MMVMRHCALLGARFGVGNLYIVVFDQNWMIVFVSLLRVVSRWRVQIAHQQGCYCDQKQDRFRHSLSVITSRSAIQSGFSARQHIDEKGTVKLTKNWFK